MKWVGSTTRYVGFYTLGRFQQLKLRALMNLLLKLFFAIPNRCISRIGRVCKYHFNIYIYICSEFIFPNAGALLLKLKSFLLLVHWCFVYFFIPKKIESKKKIPPTTMPRFQFQTRKAQLHLAWVLGSLAYFVKRKIKGSCLATHTHTHTH